MISFQSRDAIIGNIKREPCVISADQFKKIIDEVSYKNRFDILEQTPTILRVLRASFLTQVGVEEEQQRSPPRYVTTK